MARRSRSRSQRQGRDGGELGRGHATSQPAHDAAGGAAGPSLRPMDISAVAEPERQDQQAVIEDLADDPIVADAHPVRVRLARQGDAPGRPRIVREQVDGRTATLLVGPRLLT